MSGFLSSTATLLGRTVLSPVAPHSLFAVRVEHAPSTSSSEGPLISQLISACPSLDPSQSPTYKPTPWLSTGNLQTIYSAFGSFSQIDPVTYKRRVFLVPDGGTLALDISPPSLAPSEIELHDTDPSVSSGVPTVVCLHGLTGGSHESYVRNCFTHLTTPTSSGGMGYRGVVVNFRGCANVPVTSPQLYSASKTSDLRSALLLLTKLYPNSPMMGIGFSLGANVLGKYLGEQGDDTPLLAGLIVGTPFDLKAGSDALEYGGYLPQKYSAAMHTNLSRVLRRHKDTLALHKPFRQHMDRMFKPSPISKEDVETHKKHCKTHGPQDGEMDVTKPGTLKYADEIMTRLVGGLPKPYGMFPFNTANEYYEQGSCVNFIGGVKRPMLCLNAEDDPIVPSHVWDRVREAIGFDKNGKAIEGKEGTNEKVALAWTKAGGHLGWFEGVRPKRWLYKPVTEFIRAVFEQTSEDHKQKVMQRQPWKTEGRVNFKEVEIELMPIEALPVYHLPGEQVDAVTEEEESDVPHATGRLAWLLTHVLPECPLVHPNHSACGTYAPPSSDSEAKGWQVLKGQKMYFDTSNPEAGFLELDENSRVGGVAQVFRGSIDTPGSATGENKVIAGL